MPSPNLAAGTRLGPYEIIALLGAGGMGEVYRARDTRLNRDVAIKILPDAFANDPDRLMRFTREAQTLAALNHPHIAHIHGLEESPSTGSGQAAGVRALVMELVEGEDLAQRLARGPLPIDEALAIAQQIAEALEAAHDQGIVHRDLKPANVKVRPDGTVKVLDFGLAKALGEAAPSNAAPTMTSPAMTQQGIILGTAAYMSPEQARGKSVDKRADIWAFGVVLYEMLAGQPPFSGETITDVLAAVVTRDPDLTALPAATPPQVRDVLTRCLRKDPQRRLRDIGDARLDMDASSDPVASPAAQASVAHRTRDRVLMGALALAAVTALALSVPALRHFREAPVHAPEIRFDVPAPAGSASDAASFAISPDGRSLVFIGLADRQLWLRAMDSTTARPLQGTVGARYPFWSPDSRSVGFYALGTTKVYRIAINGGSIEAVSDSSGFRGASWGRGEVMLISRNGRLARVAAAGGEVTEVLAEAGVEYSFPRFLPDGQHFTYLAAAAGSPDSSSTYLASLDEPKGKRLFASRTSAQYVEPGYLLAGDGANLYAYPFDAKRGETTGERLLVLPGVGPFSASDSGGIAYRPPAGAGRFQVAWVDRSGKIQEPVGAAMATATEVELSADGRRAAIVRLVDDNFDLWLVEIARGVMSRLTLGPSLERWPTWSADGRRVAYSEGNNLYVRDANRAGTAELLLEDSQPKMPADWSPDGRFLLYRLEAAATRGDVWVLPLGGDRKPFPFVATEFQETRAQFSPDGRWVSYESDESGRPEVYVRPFPGPGGRFQVSVAGGIEARWHPNGKEIFFVNPKGELLVAAVRPSADGASLDVESPRILFQTRMSGGGNHPANFKIDYDVSGDGQRFLMLVTTDEAAMASITVVANWQPKATR